MARCWGDEKTLLFVTHYRSQECLWNTRSPLYKNNIARNNAYQALLNDMNDQSLTIKIIKTKIKNLRSVYHSEVKKSTVRSGPELEQKMFINHPCHGLQKWHHLWETLTTIVKLLNPNW